MEIKKICWALIFAMLMTFVTIFSITPLMASAVPGTNSPKSRSPVDNQNLTVAQSCIISISPTYKTAIKAENYGNFSVTTSPGCTYSATSNANWITIRSHDSMHVYYKVLYNSGSNSRSGTISVDSQTFTIIQDGCTYTITPESQEVGCNATTGVQPSPITVTVNDQDCSWTASRSLGGFIRITSGTTMKGNGTLNYSVLENTDVYSRQDYISIADKKVTIRQQGITCTFTISPTRSDSITSAGGAGTVSVTASNANCSWTATSDHPWVTITSGSSGKGNGQVGFTVKANTSEEGRNAYLKIADTTFYVNQQGATPAFSISPTSKVFSIQGGTASFTVRATSTWGSWTAKSNNEWITITSGSHGTGNGTVAYRVTPNPRGPERSGTISVAGKTFSIRQDGVKGPRLQ